MNKINNKAFTLVELLAVIVILSLLALLTTTSITKILKDSKDEISSIQMDSIKMAAETWGSQNMNKLPKSGECSYITLNDLKESGLIDSTVIDSKTGKEIDGELKIKITSKMSKFNTLVTEYEVNASIDGCEYAYAPSSSTEDGGNTGNEEYADTSGAKVDMLSGLTPVVYADNNWKVADTSSKWYDYSNQEWANAVILKTGVSKSTGDTVDVSSDVTAMLVWIPRYEYKIDGQYGKGGTSASSPGEIEVNFISKTQTTASEGYRVHPAFTFGTEELNGIWVGKFETTGTGDAPTVLPGVTSLRNQIVSTQFTTAQKFNTYVTNGDSHMMKNSEWGAVAYLSQSKYGKYGNVNYSGAEKQVRINNCSSYITGIGANSQNESESSSTCTTNTYETANGQAASTTGNITGVYDMSGGAFEYVMGYLTTASSTWGANDSYNYAGFTSAPDSKYFDAYTSTTSTTACSSGICYGHALSETSGWYGDNANFVSTINPWFIRGGGYYDSAYASVFGFFCNRGHGSSGNSFRLVLSQTTN